MSGDRERINARIDSSGNVEKNSEKDVNRSIFNFAALKTAIVNSETEKVKSMLTARKLPNLEKAYLLDLAKMNNNVEIVKTIEDTAANDTSSV